LTERKIINRNGGTQIEIAILRNVIVNDLYGNNGHAISRKTSVLLFNGATLRIKEIASGHKENPS
jgi:hypothetical protein